MNSFIQSIFGVEQSALAAKATEAMDFFIYAFAELAILFVGISFLVGVLNEFVPPERIKSVLSSRQGRGYLAGAGLGAITPFCSCSTIPLTVGLLKANAGFGPTMTFLFSSPLVNPIIVGLFFSLFGFKVTAIYMIMALGLAVFAGWLLERFNFLRFIKQDMLNSDAESGCGCNKSSDVEPQLQPMQMAATPCCAGASNSDLPMESHPTQTAATAKQPSRWNRIFRDSIRQFVSLMPFISLGLFIGAILHGVVPAEMVADIAGPDNPLAVPVSAFVGVPLYIRASTMLPIGLSLMGKGMSLGAVTALVIGGAGASLPEVVMLKGLFRWPILLAFLASVFSMAILTGYAMNILI